MKKKLMGGGVLLIVISVVIFFMTYNINALHNTDCCCDGTEQNCQQVAERYCCNTDLNEGYYMIQPIGGTCFSDWECLGDIYIHCELITGEVKTYSAYCWCQSLRCYDFIWGGGG